jgi:hypothetical protein
VAGLAGADADEAESGFGGDGVDDAEDDDSGNSGSTVGDGITGGAYWTSWAFNPLGDRTTQTQHSLSGGTVTRRSL